MAAPWMLVGRTTELQLVRRMLVDGESSGVVLSGSAGVGKTRLAAEIVAYAERSGWTAVWARATRSTAAVPFGAFAHLLAPGVTDATSPLDTMRQAAPRLRALAANDRVLVAVDDAHLLDDPSAGLVHQLASTRSAFMVVTVRQRDPASDAIRALWKDGLAERIELYPLTRATVDELLTAVLGGQVDSVTRHRLWQATQGNVLYLRELVLIGLRRGALAERFGVWTWEGELGGGSRLREAIEDRLCDVDGEQRAALELLALGEPLPTALVSKALGEHVLGALDDKGLLATIAEGRRSTLRLAHPLYGETLRHGLSELGRRIVSGRLVDLLSASGARRRDDALRLGVWWLESGRSADPAVLLAAARRAHALLDHVLAERLARAALEVGGVEARVLLGASLYGQRRYDEAARLLDEAPSGDVDPAILAEWALNASRNAFILGQARRAETVLLSAEQRLGPGNYRDRLTAYRSFIAFLNGRIADAFAAAEAAARGVHQDIETRFRVAVARTVALAAIGRTEQALVLAEEMVLEGMAMAAEQPLLYNELLAARYSVYWVAGRFAEMERLAESALADAVVAGQHELHGTWALYAGVAGLGRGRVRTAWQRLRESVAVLRQHHDPVGLLGFALASLAHAATLLGRRDEAMAAMAEWRRVRHPAVRIWDVLIELAEAWIKAADGEISAAARQAHAAADLAVTQRHPTLEFLALHQAVRMGEPGLALRIARVGATTDQAHAIPRAEHAAALAARDGEALERCAQRFAEFDLPLLAAEAAVEAAEAYRRAGRGGDAIRAMRRSRDWQRHCEGARTPVLQRGEQDPAADVLTRRELELAELAARGLSNREIADRLVLSRRTVGNHLNHVYGKLGITGRAELAELLGRCPVATSVAARSS